LNEVSFGATRNKLTDYLPWNSAIVANIISCLSEMVRV